MHVTSIGHWSRWGLAALLAVAALLMLLLPTILRDGRGTPLMLVIASYAVLAAGIVVLMRDARVRTFVMMAILTLPVFVVAVVLHNAWFAIVGSEEAFFFLLAIFVAPAMLLAGIGGAVWATIRDQRAARSSQSSPPRD